MWQLLKKIQDEETHYYVNFTDVHELLITDFVTLWYKKFSNASFLECLKESNDEEMEGIDESELVEKGKQMLKNPGDLKSVSISIEGEKLVAFMSVIYGCPLILELTLQKGSKELKVTQQLLKTIQDLRFSQTELRNLLKEKDSEIEEYKCKGGEIALRHLKTIPFNDKSHMSKHGIYEDHFGSTGVPEDLLKRSVSVAHVENDIKKQEVKEEPIEAANVKLKPKVEVKIETIKPETPSKSQSSRVTPRKRQKLNF